ncbi:MAG: WecB/TagA/CpsF family glycosyltransferase [Acidaminococcales bacterium]|jgi:N-acetylglucosaminyldiphosphoundecaprenol N-acetyl-beta-D-mannosaminyltransferase|nr:WecB/TagA/CpsF family glycosyltransferase [Acidaminococcales bacterium]
MADAFWLLDVKVEPYTMDGAAYALSRNLRNKRPAFVAMVNTEIIMRCQKDPMFKSIINSADFILPDGTGIVWAGRHLGHKVPERVTGCDLIEELFKLADRNMYRIFLLGAAPGVAEAAIESSRAKYPGAVFAGCRDGFFPESETPGIIARINQAQADILLVALGSPKQEKWIFANRAKLNSTVFLGVGGSFDVMAGRVARAPRFMQKAGLEWLFRLYKQPGRFWRMLAIPKFIFCVLSKRKGLDKG